MLLILQLVTQYLVGLELQNYKNYRSEGAVAALCDDSEIFDAQKLSNLVGK
jgi:hypothetical protein